MITLLLLGVSGNLQEWFGWMAGIQLPQSALAKNFIAVIAVVVLTIVLGRVYCSVICPLGVCQDAVSKLGGKVTTDRPPKDTSSAAPRKLNLNLLRTG